MAGKTAFGVFQGIGSSAVSAILASAGFDWMLVDMEHGAMGIETAGDMLSAIGNGGPTPMVRVAANDPATIKRALDAGAQGVMIPMVNSPAEARQALQSCKYPPQGIRGTGAGRASLYGVRWQEYLDTANEQVMVLLQAEHRDAVAHIDEILAVPGIDVIFVGPYDLACSMGHPREPGHAEVEEAIATVLAAAQRASVTPGIFCMDPLAAGLRARQGFRFIATGLDSIMLNTAARQVLQTALSGTAQPPA